MRDSRLSDSHVDGGLEHPAEPAQLQAEIITIGTELLLGEIVDTNSAWIARELTHIGLNLYYTATVGDNLKRASEAIASAMRRSNVVITTGGLGPTVDDVTREAVALATDRPLVLDEELLQEIAHYFGRRHHPMTENNRKQAQLPTGAEVIHNPVGTAPAFALEHHGHLLVCLPGVPHEMQHLMEYEVLPLLRRRFGLRGVIKSRVLHTCGIGESAIDSRIGDLMELANPTVGTAAHPGQTDVRITAKADSEEDALRLIVPVEAELRRRLGNHIYGVDRDTIGEVVGRALAAKGMRLAVAETVTGGEVARAIARSSCGGEVLAVGLVLPSVERLAQYLGIRNGVSPTGGYTIDQPLTDAAARALLRQHDNADLGLAVAGPADPGTPDAPPVHFSLATQSQVRTAPPRQGRSGVSGMGWLVHLALDLVRREVLGLGDG